ncbi:MAG TPA: hypothetical protein VMR62_36260 [Bryobacteraceae bacterium]|nr:hypothetical protein [Bryobacteraceae bacterium]
MARGFAAAPGDSRSGRVLTANFSGYQAASTALKTALRAFGNYFDARPRLRTVIADDDDRELRAFFQAGIGGSPVAGVVMISIGQGQEFATVVHECELAGLQLRRRQRQHQPSGRLDLWRRRKERSSRTRFARRKRQLGAPMYVQEYALPGSNGIPIMPYITDPVEAMTALWRRSGQQLRIVESQNQAANQVLVLFDHADPNGRAYPAGGSLRRFLFRQC